jgi:L-iditol 2-dehydrogenase
MKVGRLIGPGKLAIEERPLPPIGPGEVLISLAGCGICGTDLEKLRGNYATTGILGHEPVGVVAQVGAQVRNVAPGDRAFVHHHVPCYSCEICRRGDFTFCPTYAKTNLDPGGFAEQFRVPEENVRRGAILPLASRVDWATGTLLEPAGCALTALHRVGLPAGGSVFVVGLGPVGLLYARLAKALGAGWVGGAEIAPLRRTAAERGRIDATIDPRDPAEVVELVRSVTDGRGVDLAVVATGSPAAVRLAASLTRRGGTLNLFGLPESGSRLDVDLQELYLRGTRVIPSYATTEPDIAEVHSLVVSGRLSIGDLVSHQLPLRELGEAFRLAQRPTEALKVVVTGPAMA